MRVCRRRTDFADRVDPLFDPCFMMQSQNQITGSATLPSMARGFEVWTPNEADDQLVWSSGHYGELQSFQAASQSLTFQRGESFAGRVWEQKTPMLFGELYETDFKRFEAARAVGITSGVAWPIIDDNQVTAVVVILSSHAQGETGAFELWKRERRGELGLQGEYYANLDQVSAVSQFVKFPRGSGLPGRCWEDRTPRILNGLGRGSGFVRGQAELLAPIRMGLGLPVMRNNYDLEAVVLMLSAKASPIARRAEVWLPEEGEGESPNMRFDHGFSNDDKECEPFGGKLVEHVLKTRRPTVVGNDDEKLYHPEFECALAFPSFAGSELRAVMVLAK